MAAAVGLFWIGPRARGRELTVQAELARVEGVDALIVDLYQDRARVRGAQVKPSAPGVSWQGRLPSGRYRLFVRLRCEDGARREVLERPLELDEDLTLPVTVTATCGEAL